MVNSILSDIARKDIIAKGRYSCIYKISNKSSDRILAIKEHPKNIRCFSEKDFYVREKLAFDVIPPHPNVIKFYEYLESDDDAYFVLEFVDGYNLSRIINESKGKEKEKHVSRKEIKSYLLQLLDAIEHLHTNDVYHGDVKPENVLVCNGKVTLVDFGSSIISSQKTINIKDEEFIGTPGFLPPEVADIHYKDDIYLPFIDIWGFGCTMYFSYTKIIPFVRGLNVESNNMVKNISVDLSICDDCIRFILEHIFTKDASKRFNINEIREFLQKVPE